MEGEMEELYSKLDARRYSHPYLTQFWKNYLEEKTKNMDCSIKLCNDIIQRIETIPDIDPNTLATMLYFLR
jgi:hypothetical protein